MAGIAFPPRHPHHIPVLPIVLAALALIALAVAGSTWSSSDSGESAGGGDGDPATGPGAPPATSTTAPAEHVTETDAIAAWLRDHRDEIFPSNLDEYKGTCPDDYDDAYLAAICSIKRDDLDDHQVHSVGVFATDWGGDLLLERTASGWTVIAAEPWPELGTADHFGPPWSPMTAIAEWWAANGEAYYGRDDVAHLSDCEEARQAADVDQPILCSTLVDDQGPTRVYSSGRAGADPDVHLRLAELGDHTWVVTAADPA